MEKLKTSRIIIFLLLVVLAATLAGCNGGQEGDGASATIEAYLNSLQSKDENRMINLSCANWEAQARLEYASFAAVDLTLENPSCQQTGQDGDYTLVTCNGRIVASYGAEDLVIELSERTYQVVEEGGEWRMCGYR